MINKSEIHSFIFQIIHHFLILDRLGDIYTNVLRRMDLAFESYLAKDSKPDPDDIPQTTNPVYILGKKYSAIQELELIRRDVQSRLWCSYRKGFLPLGRPQLTSDKGWGCMLRCGEFF